MNPFSANKVEKKACRQEMRQKRAALSEEEKVELDKKMQGCFLDSKVYQDSQVLFCFVALKGEPETEDIITQGLKDGKLVAVPKCLEEYQMKFYQLTDAEHWQEQLESGTYGVMEPKENLEILIPDEKKNCVCLVPGLAFDRKGGRLGYGAGYYDRWLRKYPFIQKIGFGATRYQLEQVPTEETDFALDGLADEYTVEVWNGQ